METNSWKALSKVRELHLGHMKAHGTLYIVQSSCLASFRELHASFWQALERKPLEKSESLGSLCKNWNVLGAFGNLSLSHVTVLDPIVCRSSNCSYTCLYCLLSGFPVLSMFLM